MDTRATVGPVLDCRDVCVSGFSCCTNMCKAVKGVMWQSTIFCFVHLLLFCLFSASVVLLQHGVLCGQSPRYGLWLEGFPNDAPLPIDQSAPPHSLGLTPH